MTDRDAQDRRSASLVAAGIAFSRILGFVRVRVFAYFFGSGAEADAFNAALKIPNIIRNLVGEGTLSASFIPVYARQLAEGREDAARTVARTVAALVTGVAAAGALIGAALAPWITDLVAPGFEASTRRITVVLVRIMFPMSGVLIVSGWCLGILNTHRRFLLPYAAPGLWNIAQIATLGTFGAWLYGWRGEALVTAAAWGALGGALLQLLVQVPSAIALSEVRRARLQWTNETRRVVHAWVPVVLGAGAWQLSSLIDTQLGSLAGPGGVAFLGYAQLVSTLPVSLFGVSIAAASLPALSQDAAGATPSATRERLAGGLQRMAFFIIPSAFALAALGGVVVAALFQTGRFDAVQTEIVSGVIAAYSIGLPAQAAMRLLASGHYALGDTRTPFRIAVVTVALAAGLAFVMMQWWGVAGIALGSALAAWVNAGLNYHRLARRTGRVLRAPESRQTMKAIGAAGVATVAAVTLGKWFGGGPLSAAALVLSAFAVVYLAGMRLLGHPEAGALLRRFRV